MAPMNLTLLCNASCSCISTQLYGSNSRQEIEEGVRAYALGVLGLAIMAGLSNFIAVSFKWSTHQIFHNYKFFLDYRHSLSE